MKIVCKALGGKPETLDGLCGIGDLSVTCFSIKSRNFRCGIELAKGKTVDEIIKVMGEVIEGIPTAYEVERIAK